MLVVINKENYILTFHDGVKDEMSTACSLNSQELDLLKKEKLEPNEAFEQLKGFLEGKDKNNLAPNQYYITKNQKLKTENEQCENTIKKLNEDIQELRNKVQEINNSKLPSSKLDGVKASSDASLVLHNVFK